ncbi:uncharacterized protein BDZ99DRAFT_458716 [Mytilinidion resinicola]|uniref:Uncharacterized protein n=1 Tax=Mytilinidion resinicola TaxID=574789 RepID=A0A6A6Z3A6_9PEZI|nr:uncharacterized protein BDZ99DRAFT_458716 [Mytilinidion resinicola]KAF2814727.1 hypothetical protein BDZ99DRAFT_458716 [Mytilinidion resinicola]
MPLLAALLQVFGVSFHEATSNVKSVVLHQCSWLDGRSRSILYILSEEPGTSIVLTILNTGPRVLGQIFQLLSDQLYVLPS